MLDTFAAAIQQSRPSIGYSFIYITFFRNILERQWKVRFMIVVILLVTPYKSEGS